MNDYGAPDLPSQRHRRTERYQQSSGNANAPYVQPVAPTSAQASASTPPMQQPLQQRTFNYSRSSVPPSQQPRQPYAAVQPPKGFPQMAPGGYPPSGVVPPSMQGQWRQPPYGTQPQQPWSTQPYAAPPPSPDPRASTAPPRSGSRNQHSGGSRRPPRKRWPVVLVIVVALVAAIAAMIHIGNRAIENQQLNEYVSAYNTRFCQGVYVDGIHLGGMSQEEAFSAVTQKAQQRNDSWYVTLTFNGQEVTRINANHLGMTVDVSDVMKQAWEQGHTGDTQQRKQAMDALSQEPWYGYTTVPSGNTSVIDNILDQLRTLVYRAPRDASIVSFEPSNTRQPFTIESEVTGRYLDTSELKTRIYHMVSTMESGSLPIEPIEVPPTVTKEQLQKTVSQRSSFYTKISTSSTQNRNNNIRRAFELISGTILKPGDTFSFNDTVGKRTLENGFYPAIEYANREEVEGIGGGVCQASTTLYIAAVQAGLQIVKREPHSDKVNYTDYGKDATVYWESKKIDFSFKNNTNHNIYIISTVEADPSNKNRLVARVTIYGEYLGDNTRYDIVTQTLETLPVPLEPVRKKDKNAKYVTYEDEEYLVKGDVGYVVQSYRVKYVNNVEVERIALYKDRYEPKSDIIYYGVTKRPET